MVSRQGAAVGVTSTSLKTACRAYKTGSIGLYLLYFAQLFGQLWGATAYRLEELIMCLLAYGGCF